MTTSQLAEAATTVVNEFVDYLIDFYGPTGLYPMGVTKEDILLALCVYLEQIRDVYKFTGDSIDREHVRDILITFGYVFPK